MSEPGRPSSRRTIGRPRNTATPTPDLSGSRTRFPMEVGRSRTAFRLRSRAMQPCRSTAGSAPGANPARLGVCRPDCGGGWTFVPDASSVTRRTPSRQAGPSAPGVDDGRLRRKTVLYTPPPAGRSSLVVHREQGFHHALRVAARRLPDVCGDHLPRHPEAVVGPAATTVPSLSRPRVPSKSRSPPAACDSTRRRSRRALQHRTAVDAGRRSVVRVPAHTQRDRHGGPGHLDPAFACGAASRRVRSSCLVLTVAQRGQVRRLAPAGRLGRRARTRLSTTCPERTAATAGSSRRSADDVTMFQGRYTRDAWLKGVRANRPGPRTPPFLRPATRYPGGSNESLIRIAPWLLPGCGRGGRRASCGGTAPDAGRPERGCCEREARSGPAPVRRLEVGA